MKRIEILPMDLVFLSACLASCLFTFFPFQPCCCLAFKINKHWNQPAKYTLHSYNIFYGLLWSSSSLPPPLPEKCTRKCPHHYYYHLRKGKPFQVNFSSIVQFLVVTHQTDDHGSSKSLPSCTSALLLSPPFLWTHNRMDKTRTFLLLTRYVQNTT